jgi:hypothetical protein
MCHCAAHPHIGRCQNKVWGYNRKGYLYRYCDDCRVSMTGEDVVPKEQPPALTPRARQIPPKSEQTPGTYRDPLFSDPLWREPF